MRAGRTSTRRRLLAGAAAATAAGAGAAWADRSGEAARVWHHFAGGCAGPDGPVPPAPEDDPVAGRFRSRHVPDDDVGFMVWRPGNRADLLPVLVVLPGRGSTARAAFDELHLHAFLAAELARRGAAAGIASVDGGESYWHARPDGEDRMAMLETEFLPLLEREFGLGRPGRRGCRLVDGRLRRASRRRARPGRMVGSGGREPRDWPTYGDVWVGDAFDGRTDFQKHSVFGGATAFDRMPVWIGCGTADPFYENARRLAAALPAAETRWADGGHDACLWRLVAPHELAFAVSVLSA